MNSFRKADLIDYILWLKVYIAAGNKPTHYYNYKWQIANFLVATSDFRLNGEAGSEARQIIVPSRVSFIDSSLGHCNLFFLESGEYRGFGWVPVYNDQQFIDHLPDWIKEKRDSAYHREKVERFERTKNLSNPSNFQVI